MSLSIVFFLLGLLMGGNMHLIVITCSSDLGQHPALSVNKSATSTVTGIIDGMGTLGTAAGPFIFGRMLGRYGWTYGYLAIIATVTALTMIPLSTILCREIKEIRQVRAR